VSIHEAVYRFADIFRLLTYTCANNVKYLADSDEAYEVTSIDDGEYVPNVAQWQATDRGFLLSIAHGVGVE
jgi:hypothetical protein